MKAVISAEDKYNIGVYDTETKEIKWMTKITALEYAEKYDILGINKNDKSVVTVREIFSPVYGISDVDVTNKFEMFIFKFDDAWLGFTGRTFIPDAMNIVETESALRAKYISDDVKLKFKVSLLKSNNVGVTIKCKTFKLKMVLDISSTVEEIYDSLVEICTFDLQECIHEDVDYSYLAQESYKWFFKEDCGSIDLTDGAVASFNDKSAVIKPLGECGVLVRFVDGDWHSIDGVYRRDTNILADIKDTLDCIYDDYWAIRENEEN